MNNIQKISVAFMLMLSAGMWAGKGPSPEKLNNDAIQELRRNVHSHIGFPGSLMADATGRTSAGEEVEVLFSTDNTGHVVFVLALTKNEALKTEVEREFRNMELHRISSKIIHRVQLSFRVS